jgi:hypothetical protein
MKNSDHNLSHPHPHPGSLPLGEGEPVAASGQKDGVLPHEFIATASRKSQLNAHLKNILWVAAALTLLIVLLKVA